MQALSACCLDAHCALDGKRKKSRFALTHVHCVSQQDSLVFVVGKMDGLMVVSGRRHNADDVVATALAVEPMKFVYRGR